MLASMRFTLRKSPFALGAVLVLVVMVGAFRPLYVDAQTAGGAIASVVTGSAQTEIVLSLLTQIISGITWGLGKMTIGVINALVVPILQYNSFSSSTIIGLGWALVRDVVNMFVVIVLLVIAVATIVGYKKVSWEQALPQFLLAVILVNFSRTICGLLIDVSQVIMFTFVNALLDVAAGNFANMLGLSGYGEYARDVIISATDGAHLPITALQNLAAAYLLFVLYAVIFAVLFLLALVYLWRIVLLWVLVIMSPLTFFLGGLGGLFKFAEGASGEWWKKFTACLVIGPMLTFFLWLALSSASSGSIFESEHFPKPESEMSVVLDALGTSNFTGALLGLILLVVGMQQSASFANSMGGVASQFINEKTGKALVGGVVSYAGGYAAKRAGAEAARRAGGAGIAVGQTIGSNVPLVGGMVGRQMINASGYVQQTAEGIQKAGRVEAQKRIASYTDTQKAAHLSLIAAGRTGAIGITTKDDIGALRTDLALNAGLRKKAKESFGDTPVGRGSNEKALDSALEYANSIKDTFDDAQKEKFMKFKSERLHVLNRVLNDPKAMASHVDDAKFTGRDLSEPAVADSAVREALKKRVVRIGKGGREITAYDELMKGMYGKKLKDAALAGGADIPKPYEDEDEDFGAVPPVTPPPVVPPPAPTTSTASPRVRPVRPRGGRGGGGSTGGSGGSGGGPAAPAGGGPAPAAGGGPAGPAGGPPPAAGGGASTRGLVSPVDSLAAATARRVVDVEAPFVATPQVMPIDVDATPAPKSVVAPPVSAAPIPGGSTPLRPPKPSRPNQPPVAEA